VQASVVSRAEIRKRDGRQLGSFKKKDLFLQMNIRIPYYI
jgi:hypothetical protein